jgi:hypothetical protein
MTETKMTPAMQEVIEEIRRLDPEEQDQLAAVIRQELEAERRWDELFADPRSEDGLARLAEEARSAREEELWDLEDNGLWDWVKQYVVCINNKGYEASLEMRKIYEVLPDPEAEIHGLLRVIDEDGEDYLYSQSRFVPIDVPEQARAVFSVEPS